MQSSSTFCSDCRKQLPLELFNTGIAGPCPGCGASTMAFAYPALFRPLQEGKTGEQILIEGEASCFYHPQKKAVLSCNHCGRFLCSLCDVEFGDQHFCPTCIETGKKKGKWKNLENKRVLYDEIALALSILPMLLFYVTFITAPISIFMAFRYWNAPGSIIPRSKIRFVIAIIFSALQLTGWIVAGYLLIKNFGD